MFNTNITSVIDLITTFSTQEKCIKYLEQIRWDDVPVSPFDETSKVYKCKNNRYRCKNTGKYFNVCTGTMFEGTKISLQRWFLAIWLITCHKKGISSTQLSRDLNITQKTAWFMLQRIRACFGIENNNELEGVIECDETFYGGANKNRHKDKKVERCQGRSFKDKVPVFGMLQRGGKLTAIVIKNTQRKEIEPHIKTLVKKGSKVITDEWHAYSKLNTDYNHSIVNHAKKEYVSLDDNTIHSNTIEGAWKIFKNSSKGMYNHVSKRHLQFYVDEFVYRYNTRDLTEADKFNWLLLNSNVRTTYNKLIA